MSRINELIQQFCPDGVEYLQLGDVAEYRRGSFPQPYGNIEWYGGDGALPFVQVADVAENMTLVKNTKQKISKLAQSKSVFVPKGTVIVTLQGSIGRVAITQYDSYVDRTLAIFEKYKIRINKKYFAYQLEKKFEIEKEFARGSTLKTITKEEFTKFLIPLPPLPIQEEIVNILDKFTLLEAELEAELEARKKQYEHYRDRLLSFEGKNVEWKTLGEVSSNIASGKNKVRVENGEFPIYGSTGIIGFTNEYIYTEKQLLIARVGANAGLVQVANGKYDVSDNTLIIQNLKDIKLDFLYYILQHKNINQYAVGGGQPLITAGQLKKLLVPIPSLPEQERIVNILDKFDALVNDISIGLPAEIEARRKQYEYYRNRLLTFKKAGNE